MAANEIIGSNLKNHSQTPVVKYATAPQEAGKKCLENGRVNALKNLIYNNQRFNDLLQST